MVFLNRLAAEGKGIWRTGDASGAPSPSLVKITDEVRAQTTDTWESMSYRPRSHPFVTEHNRGSCYGSNSRFVIQLLQLKRWMTALGS